MKTTNDILLFSSYDLMSMLDITYHESRSLIKQYANHKTYISENEIRYIPNIDLKCLDDRIEFYKKFGV
jgi:hypothetical protein